jgi:hypothetical protein
LRDLVLINQPGLLVAHMVNAIITLAHLIAKSVFTGCLFPQSFLAVKFDLNQIWRR